MNKKDYKKLYDPIVDGDEKGTGLFFTECMRKAIAVLRGMGCKELEDVKDILMEAYQILLENLKTGKCKFDSEPGSYLIGIARIIWLNRSKSGKNEVLLTEHEWEKINPEDEEEHEDEELEKSSTNYKEALIEVWRKFDKGNCKAMLTSLYADKKTYVQIAQEHNTTLKSIKNKLSRCRNYLKSYAESLLDNLSHPKS